MKTIRLEVGAGEVLDRLSILQIKVARAITEPQRDRLGQELSDLRRAAAEAGLLGPAFEAVFLELREVNGALWNIEDALRACEEANDFGGRFIDLARAVYTSNDRRSRLKRQIDERFGSRFAEEKVYAARPADDPRRPR